jgi:hypothetical protein
VADGQERGERFAREIASMRIADPAPGRHDLWLRVGLALMLGGVALAAFGYYRSQGADDPMVQRDALTLGVLGICGTIFGSALYLRYSVTKVLRFWLARISYDLQVPATPDGEAAGVAPTALAPPAVPPIRAPRQQPQPQADRLGGLQ